MLRVSGVGIGLGAVLAAPLVLVERVGVGGLELAAVGLAQAVDRVGWVLVPQLVLAVGVLGLALQRVASRAAGLGDPPPPTWLEPAVESALLLGLLGTVSGMVSGFVGLTPDEIEPGPLVHALGVALRSSLVGFLIALVGVWVKARGDAPVAGVRTA